MTIVQHWNKEWWQRSMDEAHLHEDKSANMVELDHPFLWKEKGLTVTHDGCNYNGVRIHVVAEDVRPCVMANAMVMGIEYYNKYLRGEEFYGC